MPKPEYKILPRALDTMVPITEEPTALTGPVAEDKKNVRVVGHSDLSGWGDTFQIQVRDGLAYVAASGANGHNGLTILDVSNPAKPKVVNQISDPPGARTHKILLVGDVLYTNSEKRPESDDPELIGGMRMFDLSDPADPRLINYIETEGRGIHRPVHDRKRDLLYCSGFKDGCRGKVLWTYDVKEPASPELLSQCWIEGQNEGAGETPSWNFEELGWGVWLHEANPFGDYATCGFWNGGIAMFDMADPRRPEFKWRHNPHETHGWPGCYHTFLVPPGSDFAIVVTECVTMNCAHPPAFVTFYDMRNPLAPLPISTFHPYEIDPDSMRPKDDYWCQLGARYGAHNVWLDMTAKDLMYICWYGAGLRIVDWSNPFRPKEVGHFIPAGNAERWFTQSNDVFVDTSTGLIYLGDRWGLGLYILEFTG
ncbi:MAG TPA: hypothetical protein DDZ83_09935 [Nitrospinae bacterium]|nr:hypothetical protein [Nitrospinota bacterium]